MSFMADEVLQYTHFRPGFAEYPAASVALQEAVESVVTGTAPEDAAAAYQAALEEIVGADAVAVAGTEAPAGTDAAATTGG
jgi:multiple sugar transport system substrate-binding protein